MFDSLLDLGLSAIALDALRRYGVRTPADFDRLTYSEAFQSVARGDPIISEEIERIRRQRKRELE